MKTPDSLDEIVRSWTPRGPSAQLKQRLFASEVQAPDRKGQNRAAHHLPWWQTLGASAVAFGVAVMTLLNVAQLTATGTSSSAWLSLSNHSCAASFAMASAPINTWRAPIFGWTNDGVSGSNARSFDLLSTNRNLR